MRLITTLSILLLLTACKKELKPEEKSDETSLYGFDLPSEFYPKERAQVLVVGTFHFNYPGLDSHKTEDQDKIDVLKEPRSSEVSELVEYIKRFKPTKIAIEARESWDAVEKLREYKSGEHRDKRDERYQLAMRIADDLGIDTLFSVDRTSLRSDIYKRDSIFHNSLFDKIDWDKKDPYWDIAKKWLDYRDERSKETTILNYFKNLNTRESHNANYGLYLTGSISQGDGQGADHLSMWWYNRNLRIFSDIVNITEGPQDRIMVLMGNGHAAVLRQLFEASPQYHYLEFNEL